VELLFLAGTGTPEYEKRTISKALSAAGTERSNLMCSSNPTAPHFGIAWPLGPYLIDAAGPWRDWQPKHGGGGHATQSPRFRLWARLEAERTPKQSRPKSKFLGSIHELFARGKPR